MRGASSSASFWIVTPSYNQDHFISQTIESVLDQKDYPVHYWVIDGKSSDTTPTILRQYSTELHWLSEPDEGQTDAINKGLRRLEKTAGKNRLDPDQVYVAYLNSDDYYLPGAFRIVAETFASHPQAAWVVGDCLIVDSQGRQIQSAVQLYKSWWRRLPLHLGLAITNPIPQPAVFIRLSALRKVGEFNQKLRYTMDYEYWWRLLTTTGAPIRIQMPLAAFRIHQDSKGGSQYQKQFAEEFQVARQFVSNPLLLFLHHLHTLMIVSIYRFLK